MQRGHVQNQYIVAPSPVTASTNYFWRLICEMNVNLIVVFDEPNEFANVCG